MRSVLDRRGPFTLCVLDRGGASAVHARSFSVTRRIRVRCDVLEHAELQHSVIMTIVPRITCANRPP